MNIAKMIKGEPMPDKADPKFKEKAERAHNAGRRFAKFIKLDKLAYIIQNFANNHRRIFLASFLSLIGFMLFVSTARTVSVLLSHKNVPSAIEAQHRMLEKQRDKRIRQSKEADNTQSLSEYMPEYRNFEKN